MPEGMLGEKKHNRVIPPWDISNSEVKGYYWLAQPSPVQSNPIHQLNHPTLADTLTPPIYKHKAKQSHS